MSKCPCSICYRSDEAFAKMQVELIKEYDLAADNGTYHVTSGLPPECGPCSLKAVYASGEILTFTVNGNPDAEWSGAVLDAFAQEFKAHGIEFPPTK